MLVAQNKNKKQTTWGARVATAVAAVESLLLPLLLLPFQCLEVVGDVAVRHHRGLHLMGM
jgi:hypothetical protein